MSGVVRSMRLVFVKQANYHGMTCDRLEQLLVMESAWQGSVVDWAAAHSNCVILRNLSKHKNRRYTALNHRKHHESNYRLYVGKDFGELGSCIRRTRFKREPFDWILQILSGRADGL